MYLVVYLCSLKARWPPLRKLFWIVKLYISLGSITRVLFCSFNGVTFLDILCSSKVSHCLLHFWKSSHLLQSLLTDFRGERLHQSALLEILGVSQTFSDAPLPSSYSLLGRNFRIMCLLGPTKLGWVLRDSFIFPSAVPSPNLAELSWMLISVHGSLRALPVEECRVLVGGGENAECWGHAKLVVGSSQVRRSMEFMDRALHGNRELIRIIHSWEP